MDSSVFGDEYAAAYDVLYGDKDYDAEAQLIRTALHRYGKGNVRALLDLGCGTGNHALRLASTGLDIVAVDRSSSMLDQLMLKAAALNDGRSRIHVRQGDVATIDLGRAFDAAIMMFAVLGYQTTNARVLETLRNVRRHLRAGGIFLADFWYGPAVLFTRPSERTKVINSGDRQVIRTVRTDLDTASHVANVHFKLWHLEAKRLASYTEETHAMRFFFPLEVGFLLESAGFELSSMTAFPSIDAPLSDSTWNAFLVARAV